MVSFQYSSFYKQKEKILELELVFFLHVFVSFCSLSFCKQKEQAFRKQQQKWKSMDHTVSFCKQKERDKK